MFNEENALLLRSIIAHLSIDCPCDSAALTGDQDQVLDGLRGEGTEHGFGTFTYSHVRDPSGYLLKSARSILLTKRGALFSPAE